MLSKESILFSMVSTRTMKNVEDKEMSNSDARMQRAKEELRECNIFTVSVFIIIGIFSSACVVGDNLALKVNSGLFIFFAAVCCATIVIVTACYVRRFRNDLFNKLQHYIAAYFLCALWALLVSILNYRPMPITTK